MIKAFVIICICLYKTYVLSLSWERKPFDSLLFPGAGRVSVWVQDQLKSAEKLRERDLTMQRKLQDEFIFFSHFEFPRGCFSCFYWRLDHPWDSSLLISLLYNYFWRLLTEGRHTFLGCTGQLDIFSQAVSRRYCFDRLTNQLPCIFQPLFFLVYFFCFTFLYLKEGKEGWIYPLQTSHILLF